MRAQVLAIEAGFEGSTGGRAWFEYGPAAPRVSRFPDHGPPPGDQLGVVKPSTRRDLVLRIERARAHLHNHLDRAVPLRELAVVAGISQFHLARYFALLFACPPAAYHRRLRLHRAAEFLAAGDGSVADAAELIGYSDAVALCHAFRKQFGEAPRRWSARMSA